MQNYYYCRWADLSLCRGKQISQSHDFSQFIDEKLLRYTVWLHMGIVGEEFGKQPH